MERYLLFVGGWGFNGMSSPRPLFEITQLVIILLGKLDDDPLEIISLDSMVSLKCPLSTTYN
jgi:hypothetical protein